MESFSRDDCIDILDKKWLSVVPPSGFAIDTIIEAFSLLRIADLVVDAVDVVDVSVSEIVAFRINFCHSFCTRLPKLCRC